MLLSRGNLGWRAVSVGFAVGVALNLLLSLSVTHHREALEGVQVLKEWIQI